MMNFLVEPFQNIRSFPAGNLFNHNPENPGFSVYQAASRICGVAMQILKSLVDIIRYFVNFAGTLIHSNSEMNQKNGKVAITYFFVNHCMGLMGEHQLATIGDIYNWLEQSIDRIYLLRKSVMDGTYAMSVEARKELVAELTAILIIAYVRQLVPNAAVFETPRGDAQQQVVRMREWFFGFTDAVGLIMAMGDLTYQSITDEQQRIHYNEAKTLFETTLWKESNGKVSEIVQAQLAEYRQLSLEDVQNLWNADDENAENSEEVEFSEDYSRLSEESN